MPALPSPSLPEQDVQPVVTPGIVAVAFRIPALAVELKGVRDRVTAAAVAFGLDRRGAFELAFAVNEAATNAVKHGSPDADGTIGLSIVADGDALICTVSDCGPFVPKIGVTDPAAAESGRGFAFMSAVTDHFALIVEPGATIVHLHKLRSANGEVRDA